MTLLACVSAPPEDPWGPERATASGTFLVAESGDRLRIRLSDGTPVIDASVQVDSPSGPVLVDPGECDDIGELRCFHPGGVYRLLDPPDGPLTVRIDASAGADALSL